ASYSGGRRQPCQNASIGRMTAMEGLGQSLALQVFLMAAGEAAGDGYRMADLSRIAAHEHGGGHRRPERADRGGDMPIAIMAWLEGQRDPAADLIAGDDGSPKRIGGCALLLGHGKGGRYRGAAGVISSVTVDVVELGRMARRAVEKRRMARVPSRSVGIGDRIALSFASGERL